MILEFSILADDKIASLVKVICCPGGMINNPAAVAPSGAGNPAVLAT